MIACLDRVPIKLFPFVNFTRTPLSPSFTPPSSVCTRFSGIIPRRDAHILPLGDNLLLAFLQRSRLINYKVAARDYARIVYAGMCGPRHQRWETRADGARRKQASSQGILHSGSRTVTQASAKPTARMPESAWAFPNVWKSQLRGRTAARSPRSLMTMSLGHFPSRTCSGTPWLSGEDTRVQAD